MTPGDTTFLEPAPWPPAVTPVDLKGVYQELGCLEPGLKPTTGRYRRMVSLVEHQPRRIEAEAAVASAWVDGIQASCLIGRVEFRDLVCVMVAAGAASIAGLTSVNERLAVVCSALDEPMVTDLQARVPVVGLPSTQPWHLPMEIDAWTDQARRRMEQLTISQAAEVPGEVLVCDGQLNPELQRSDVVGIVKSATDTDFLPDPNMLPSKGGWRSPAFVLLATTIHERDRLSCYVRLRDATPQHPWSYSLIRVEVFADVPDATIALDRAAALAVATRGYPGPDPRWEIQCAPMRACEERLKARIPAAIQILS